MKEKGWNEETLPKRDKQRERDKQKLNNVLT